MRQLRGGLWVIVLMTAGGCAWWSPQQVGSVTSGDFVDQGQAYLEQGLLDSALAAFGMALEVDPTLLDAHMNMGSIYRQHGNYDLAARCYQRAVTLDANHFDARYAYGWMQHLQGFLQKAIESYLHALLIRPDSFDTHLHLAGAYLQLGQPAEALPHAKRATELKPEHQNAWANLAVAYSLLDRHDQAVDAYRQALELGEMSEPILMGLGNAHLRTGRYEQAIVVFRSINKGELGAAAYQRIGYAQFKMRRFADALDSFRIAIKLDGEDPVLLNGVGVCLMAMYLKYDDRDNTDDRDQALDAWRRSMQMRPDQPHIADLVDRYQHL